VSLSLATAFQVTQDILERYGWLMNSVLKGGKINGIFGERAAHGGVDQVGDTPVCLGCLDPEGLVKVRVKVDCGSPSIDSAHVVSLASQRSSVKSSQGDETHFAPDTYYSLTVNR
jgi:hypothetical protein